MFEVLVRIIDTIRYGGEVNLLQIIYEMYSTFKTLVFIFTKQIL